ncbi:MAG: hypothetical protein JJT90_16120 [Ectothiorhodospiraceae bacterium]|nr:hypothetical protein [Ectothiorhodospiraceae bacterium]
MAKIKDLNEGVEYNLTYRDVVDILRLIKESEFCESLNLDVGGIKVSFTRHSEGTAPVQRSKEPPPHATHEPAPTSPGSSEGRTPEGDRYGDYAVVRAPSVGVFYRSPEPGAPPYVAQGDVVNPGDTVGLLEVMKLYSPITTDVAGEVVEILAENGALVESGQAILLVNPDGGALHE